MKNHDTSNHVSQLALNLRAARQHLKVSVHDIADHLGITERAYHDVENGISELTCSRLEKIAKFLKVSVSYIVTFDQPHTGGIHKMSETHDNIVSVIGVNHGPIHHEKQAFEEHIRDLRVEIEDYKLREKEWQQREKEWMERTKQLEQKVFELLEKINGMLKK